jgi:hypothetical protein
VFADIAIGKFQVHPFEHQELENIQMIALGGVNDRSLTVGFNISFRRNTLLQQMSHNVVVTNTGCRTERVNAKESKERISIDSILRIRTEIGADMDELLNSSE